MLFFFYPLYSFVSLCCRPPPPLPASLRQSRAEYRRDLRRREQLAVEWEVRIEMTDRRDEAERGTAAPGVRHQLKAFFFGFYSK